MEDELKLLVEILIDIRIAKEEIFRKYRVTNTWVETKRRELATSIPKEGLTHREYDVLIREKQVFLAKKSDVVITSNPYITITPTKGVKHEQ